MARTNVHNNNNTNINNNNNMSTRNSNVSGPQATVVVRSNTPSSCPSGGAVNQISHNNYNNCDVVRNAGNAPISNQPKTNVMNGPKQLPQLVNGAKHNHLDNHYDAVKVCIKIVAFIE